MMNPIVSVIVPIYDVEKYLQQCIESICTQSYSNLEIILVDDGSPDDCGNICDNNAELDSRIIVIHKENGGLSSARNAGLDIAKGEYIAFIDSDDTIHPQFIEILVGLCEQFECDIAQCDYLVVAENSIKLPLNTQQSIMLYNNRQSMHELCCTGNAARYGAPWNKIYKRVLFENIRYPVGRIHEDEFTTYLLLWNAKKLAVTNQYMYYHLRRETSIMGRPFSIERLDVLDAFRERMEFLKNNNLRNEYICTLHTLVHLYQSSYESLQKNVEECDEICARLQAEKERLELLLNDLTSSNNQLSVKCAYPKQAKIVLYGAGHWGRIYYEWISQNHCGTIVGWVDSEWHERKNVNAIIEPIDSVLGIQFDYILITIENRRVQEEVAANLVSWGIPREKILLT